MFTRPLDLDALFKEKMTFRARARGGRKSSPTDSERAEIIAI